MAGNEKNNKSPYLSVWHGKADFTVVDQTIPDPQNYEEGRVMSCLAQVLRDNEANGDTAMPKLSLLNKSLSLLNRDKNKITTGKESINKYIDRLLSSEWLFAVTGGIAMKKTFNKEAKLCGLIKKFAKGSYGLKNDVLEEMVQAMERDIRNKGGSPLGKDQRNALLQSINPQLFILAGGPGTGKTTTLKHIVNMLERNWQTITGKTKPPVIRLAAPTGKAAKRMAESCGRESQTIHQLLKHNGEKFRCDEKNQLKADLVVVDESSMIDIELGLALFKALPDNCKVILMGDPNQLPPVGAGEVLTDMLESQVVSTAWLKETFRQKGDCSIVPNAAAICEGYKGESKDDLVWDKSFRFTSCRTEDIKDYLVQYASLNSSLMVLSANKEKESGVYHLNYQIQDDLRKLRNPRYDFFFRVANRTFHVGDRVLFTKNTKSVKNGELGSISSVNLKDQTFTVSIDDDMKTFGFTSEEAQTMILGWSITIHKSQGSEADVVVILSTPEQESFLTRKMLYTAVTRAKKSCVILGDKDIFERVCFSPKKERRNTVLYSLLKE